MIAATYDISQLTINCASTHHIQFAKKWAHRFDEEDEVEE